MAICILYKYSIVAVYFIPLRAISLHQELAIDCQWDDQIHTYTYHVCSYSVSSYKSNLIRKVEHYVGHEQILYIHI